MKSPLKWHGGKTYLASWILQHAPPHIHYVEPFFGGGAVLFAKDPDNCSEVVNDLNGELITFWKVLQNEKMFAEMHRILQATPFSEELYEDAEDMQGGPVERAVKFFIRCRQSRAGKFKSFATLTRNRLRQRQNGDVSAWWSAVEGLPEVYHRLRRVVILHRHAIDVLISEDGLNTFFYCDPPYLHETRVSTADYQHEMSEKEHKELLREVKQCIGKVMLSGYDNDLYNQELNGWRKVTYQIANHASSAENKPLMTECLWMNYAPVR